MAPQPSNSDSNEINQAVAPPDLLTRRKIVMRNAGLPRPVNIRPAMSALRTDS